METVISKGVNFKVTSEVSAYMLSGEIKKIIRVRQYYGGKLENELALKEEEFDMISKLVKKA